LSRAVTGIERLSDGRGDDETMRGRFHISLLGIGRI
jgi:hypothetical protein